MSRKICFGLAIYWILGLTVFLTFLSTLCAYKLIVPRELIVFALCTYIFFPFLFLIPYIRLKEK
jgi:hypothetical protein